jgi:hypothetical protein
VLSWPAKNAADELKEEGLRNEEQVQVQQRNIKKSFSNSSSLPIEELYRRFLVWFIFRYGHGHDFRSACERFFGRIVEFVF